MAPDKNDFVSTRERLEFLLDNENTGKSTAPQGGSSRQAFLSGVAFSGLIAGSIFLTHFIDTKLQQTSATDDSSSSVTMAGVVAAAGTAGANAPAGTAGGGAPGMAGIAIPSSGPASIETDGSRRTGDVAPGMRIAAADARPSSFLRIMNTPGSIQNITPPTVPADVDITPTPFTPKSNQTSTSLLPVAGLSTSRSVITGVADPQTLTASYYWTFSLKNTSGSSKEAQMNIVLPDGAVVSRATLWINGKAEEAAFNSTWAVQNAYDWIVSRHRDPLVITQTENNKILLKASPVMPNKEMKIRIGMTVPMKMGANGQCQMELPHVLNANLDTSCIQNVHITSNAPLFANDTHMTSAPQKNGFLLRGNLASTDLSKLQVTMQRNAEIKRFATRATHSYPAGYILAEMQQDNQDLYTLKLSKVIEKPDCPMITDDHAAFRLSYLWAKEEINRLMNSNESDQAVELATVYRVVSQVSGAVVLERQSDYEYNGLDRNMYKSMAYVSQAKKQQSAQYDAPGGSGANDDMILAEAPRQDAAQVPAPPMSQPSPAPMPMAALKASAAPSSGFAPSVLASAQPSSRRRAEHNSVEKGRYDKASQATPFPENKSIDARDRFSGGLVPPRDEEKDSSVATTSAPTLSDATTTSAETPVTGINSTGTVRVMNQSNSDRVVRLAGPVATWLQNGNFLSGSEAVATALLLSCLGLTFAGGLGLLALALMRFCQHKPGAMQFTAAGLTWLVMAALWPLFSQVVFVVFGMTYLVQTGFSALKPFMHR